MSNLPALYQEPTFGNLVTLPTVHEQNQSLLTRAKAACDPVVAELPKDLTVLSAEELEALDSKLNGLQSKLSDGEKISLERRKPFTQYMDKIKTEFTGIEAGFKTIFATFKKTRDAIAKERIARQQAESNRQAKEIAKRQEEVMYRTHLFNDYNTNFITVLNGMVTKMNVAFNSKKADEVASYTNELSQWNPAFNAKQWNAIYVSSKFPIQYLTQEEADDIGESVQDELINQHSAKAVADLTKERDRLIELTESRIKELKESDAATIAARLKKEEDDRQAELTKQLEQQKQQSEVQQENELLNATFEVAANGADPIILTKNTTAKKKYNPTTHAAWAAIIQQWVSTEMPTLTVEDLATKLKFMLTSANAKLNKGTALEAKGLLVEDDISTRTTKIAK